MESIDTHTPKCYDTHPIPGERLANGSRNSDRNGEELLQEVLDGLLIFWEDAKHREVAPQARNRPEFAIGYHLLFRLTVPHGEEHVFFKRHDEDLGLDSPEGRFQITARVFADVSVLPLPGHAKQVIGIHRKEVALPEADHEVL